MLFTCFWQSHIAGVAFSENKALHRVVLDFHLNFTCWNILKEVTMVVILAWIVSFLQIALEKYDIDRVVCLVDPPMFCLFSCLLPVTVFGWQSAKLNLQKFSCGWDCLRVLALLSNEILTKTEGTYQEDSPSLWHSPMFIHAANTFGEKLHLVLIYVCVTFTKLIISIWKLSLNKDQKFWVFRVLFRWFKK
jgi:hypothetical protein